jgi:hypothetical protein
MPSDKRLEAMVKGAEELETWVTDLVRLGLASLQADKSTENSPWNDAVARMVDTQLGGFARRLRELQLLPTAQADWGSETLSGLAEVYAAAKAMQHADRLVPGLRMALMEYAGVATRKDTVLASGERVQDRWAVIGQWEGMNIDNAGIRRTWLFGHHSKRFALFLDYNYNNMGYADNWRVGDSFKGEMAFYPSAYPLRALFAAHEITSEIIDIQGFSHLNEMLDAYAFALSQNPWISEFPAVVEAVIPSCVEGKFVIADENADALPLLYNEENDAWRAIALTGGHPVRVFGEWNGTGFRWLQTID